MISGKFHVLKISLARDFTNWDVLLIRLCNDVRVKCQLSTPKIHQLILLT